MSYFHVPRLTLVLVLGLLLAGCQKQTPPASGPAPAKSGSATADKHDHSHEEGPHGGVVAEWGDHEYHAEFTVDHKTKTVTVYVLDKHAARAPKIDAAKVGKVMLTITTVQPPLTLELKPEPSKTDAKGIAFVGTHDAFAKEMEFSGNISGTIDGKPYSGDFKEEAHDHEKKQSHGDGSHPGGVHVAFAKGKYYAEAVLHKGGALHLFLFCKDINKVVEAEKQTVTAYARTVGTQEFTTFDLKPEPLPGDDQGYTSRFAGQLPAELQGKPLEITVPALKLAGERFHLAFQTVDKPHGTEHAAADGMPAKVEDNEERRLYLEPAGMYTTADIQANGNVTASEKFKTFKAAHDLKPKVGDKLCPVTMTKANPECTWIIGGKKYEFCCPPCVDEFVKLAKEDPKAVRPPEEYVKR